jgi:hypothetical protein
MTITPEQRAYARLAGIMYLANYVLQDLGDRVTMRRGPERFADTARWAAESAVANRVALVEVAAGWVGTRPWTWACCIAWSVSGRTARRRSSRGHTTNARRPRRGSIYHSFYHDSGVSG